MEGDLDGSATQIASGKAQGGLCKTDQIAQLVHAANLGYRCLSRHQQQLHICQIAVRSYRHPGIVGIYGSVVAQEEVEKHIVCGQIQHIALGEQFDFRATALVAVRIGDVIYLIYRVVKTHVGVIQAHYGAAKFGTVVTAGRIKTGADFKRIALVQWVVKEKGSRFSVSESPPIPGLRVVAPKTGKFSCKFR